MINIFYHQYDLIIQHICMILIEIWFVYFISGVNNRMNDGHDWVKWSRKTLFQQFQSTTQVFLLKISLDNVKARYHTVNACVEQKFLSNISWSRWKQTSNVRQSRRHIRNECSEARLKSTNLFKLNRKVLSLWWLDMTS